MNSPSGSTSESSIFDSKSPPTKVCIICCHSSVDGNNYAVFIVDLESQVNGDEFIPIAPTLLLDRKSLGNDYELCVLNSTLYLFEAGSCNIYSKRGKSVYTYDLSRTENCSLKLDKSRLGKAAPDMLRPKANPMAIATRDGKRIIVFSSQIIFDPSNSVAAEQIDFELYNPAEKSWKELPSLSDYLRRIRRRPISFKIKAFTFLNKSIFLIQTEIGIFSLDIDSPRLGWGQEVSYAGARSIPFPCRFFVIEDELCLSTSGAYDISAVCIDVFDRLKAFPFPKSSFGDDFKHEVRHYRFINVIEDDFDNGGGGDFRVVQVQTGINRDTMHAHMLLDVCICNLAKYREDKWILGDSARLNTSIVKSFKFVVDGDLCSKFYPVNLLPILARTN